MRMILLALLCAGLSGCISNAHAETGPLQSKISRWSCNSGVTTSTTLTECQATPGTGLSLYITDITMSASAAATTNSNEQLALKYGSGTNCGTGTTTVYAVFNPATGGVAKNFDPAIKIPANKALCWMDAVAGSKFFAVSGWTGP